MSISQRLMVGGLKGAFYGIMVGSILGAAGNFVAPPIDYKKILVWENRFGKKTRFTNLDSIDTIKEDLLVIYNARGYNEEAFNEAFRNLQSAITIYHPIKTGLEKAEMMTATKMTNYIIRSSRAIEAILIATRAQNQEESEYVEKAMMSIQLSFEELINSVRHESKHALPHL